MTFDDKLWCEECGLSLEDDCKQHGMYSIIRDKTIPPRAKLTTPHQLTVKQLELRAGNKHVYGTFAKKIIQKRTLFGPFEGVLKDNWNHQREDRLTLKVFGAEGQGQYLDCMDESVCNWMMFVRPADRPDQQNMVAFQYRGKIYFASTKVMASDEELRVWYARDYANQMGVGLLRGQETPSPPSPPSPFTLSNPHVDEEFLTPGKKSKKVSPEKTMKKNLTALKQFTESNVQNDNLQTLANIALQPPLSFSCTQGQNIPLPSINTPTPVDPTSVPAVSPPVVADTVSVSTSIQQAVTSLPESVLPQFAVSVQAPTVPASIAPSAQATLQAQQPITSEGISLPVGGDQHSVASSVPTSNLPVSSGAIAVSTSAVPIHPSPVIQSCKIDDRGILTIEETDFKPGTTLTVEILSNEVEPMLNRGQQQVALQEDPLDRENAELTIDESSIILLSEENGVSEVDNEEDDNEVDADDDAEVEPEGDATNKTCRFCHQSFPLQTYSDHSCPQKKRTANTKKRNILTNKKSAKGRMEKPRRTIKLKPGNLRKRKGSLNQVLHKMVPVSGNCADTQPTGAGKGDSTLITETGERRNEAPTASVISNNKESQELRKIKGSRKRKSGVVRKKVKSPYFECDRCEMVFSTQDRLQVHLYSHTGEKPFVCDHEGCGKSFVNKFKLKRHVTTHGEGTEFRCPYCDKTFRRKDHLKNHLKVHDPNKILLVCEICSKEYASRFAFRTHIAIHKATQGELKCYVCSKVFPRKEDLLHHLKVHSGARSVKDPTAKKHKCRFCSKMFFVAKDVRRHEVVHTKQKEHMCHLCPQQFGRKDHLVRHLRSAHDKQQPDPALNLDNPATSIVPPTVKLAKETKKRAKKKQRGLRSQSKNTPAVTDYTFVARDSGASSITNKPPSLASLQSQPTVILSETKIQQENQSPAETKSDYVLLDPRGQANILPIPPSYATSQQHQSQSEVPVFQQVSTIQAPTPQSSEVQTYLELQPSEYFQFVLSQNSNVNLPKGQQVVNQIPDQNINQTQTVFPPQTSLTRSKSQRKPRRQRTKTKVNLPSSQATLEQEPAPGVNSQPQGVLTLPNVQNLFEQNHPSLATFTPGATSFNLDNLSFSALKSVKPQENPGQGQVSALGPVFPESGLQVSFQPGNAVEAGNIQPLTIYSVNPSMGTSEQVPQFQVYQYINPADLNTNQIFNIEEKTGTMVVNQQQNINQTQPVPSSYNEHAQIPITQTEASYPHAIVPHDSEAVKLFFPEEHKTVL